jgi:hypothetical protein
VNFLNQIRVSNRLFLLAVIAAVIAAFPTVLFVRDRWILMETIKLEQQGVPPIRSLLNVGKAAGTGAARARKPAESGASD